MKKRIDCKNIKQFINMRDKLTYENAINEANRCLLCKDAPCSQGCPAGTDPAKFIRQLRFENLKGAARTIRNNNPLGSICALVCPTEKLCEQNCSTCAIEEPINISGLQHFATEYGINAKLEPLKPGKQATGKVAVIGAGPAGITCAIELAKIGYKVTIFEKNTQSGGIAHWGIPTYRLDAAMLINDLKNLADLQIDTKYNSLITTQEQLTSLLNKGYQAIFIGAGLSEPQTLPLLQNYANATDYAHFLSKVKSDPVSMKLANKNIAVIGGGSVAIDAACSAAALGANKVYIISLESLAELPANQEEIEIAHKLHIIFKPNTQITKIHSNNNKQITSLSGQEVTWIEPNNFNPNNAKLIDGTEFNLNIDYIIQAIGARSNKTLQQSIDVITANNSAIFTGGDIANGGNSIAQAVGDGKEAAKQIHTYLTKGEK